MDRLWGWCWRRHGTRYRWCAVAVLVVGGLPIWVTLGVVGAEIEGVDVSILSLVVINAAASVVLGWLSMTVGGDSVWEHVHAWAAGRPSSARVTLEATYVAGRAATRNGAVQATSNAALGQSLPIVLADAPITRALAYAAVGALFGLALDLVAAHAWAESLWRPVRAELTAGSDVGDDLPRPRPSFATHASVSVLATVVCFAYAGVGIGAMFDVRDDVWLLAAIPLGLLVAFGFTNTLSIGFAPALRPLRDLETAAARVADGDFTQRIPVVQDDDLGTLASSFNRMQDGLAERERLQAAFGSYVDPELARRLLAQHGDLFSGDRVDVTVMFVDIRDFTPFAEANTAEDTVAHLNTLFAIVIDAVDDAGGHVNKFLGDGAMVVFGAPERVDDHADRAVACAARIQHAVTAGFGGTTRLGIGINTGTVIAGTIGSPKKLEFTLIGDAVNVAARVEQLTKVTGDAVLVTQQTLDSLAGPRHAYVDRGMHHLKGKAEPVTVHALDIAAPEPTVTD